MYWQEEVTRQTNCAFRKSEGYIHGIGTGHEPLRTERKNKKTSRKSSLYVFLSFFVLQFTWWAPRQLHLLPLSPFLLRLLVDERRYQRHCMIVLFHYFFLEGFLSIFVFLRCVCVCMKERSECRGGLVVHFVVKTSLVTQVNEAKYLSKFAKVFISQSCVKNFAEVGQLFAHIYNLKRS